MIQCDGCGKKCEASDECRIGVSRVSRSNEWHFRHVCEPCRKTINAAAAEVFGLRRRIIVAECPDNGVSSQIAVNRSSWKPGHILAGEDFWPAQHAFTLEPEPWAATVDPVRQRLAMMIAVTSLLATAIIGFAIGRMTH